MSRVSKSSDAGMTYYPSSDYSVIDGTSTVYVSGPSSLAASIEYDGTTATTKTIHTDHLGSTSVVTNEDGTMIELLDYNPYGTERSSWSSTSDSGEAEVSKTYIGEYSDDETSLSYLNARYYDPERGQFLSQDSVYLNMGTDDKRTMVLLLDSQSQNSYSYARDNPIILKDPGGECPFCVAFVPYAPSIIAGLTALVSTPALQAQVSDGLSTLVDQSSSFAGKAWATLGILSSFTAPGTGVAAEWSLSPFVRGRVFENIYGANLGWNFPVIDRFMNGVATSIKSLNLNAKTYQNMGALASKLRGYVDDVAGFMGADWGGDLVEQSKILSRQLQVIIPQGSLTDEASRVFQEVTDFAKNVGVKLNVIEH